MDLKDFPRSELGFFPTPLVRLERLSKLLGGPRLLMKRDDLTGLATGGNKTRKLEYLVGEALALGCDCLVTGGAAQSNHCRQTAAAAAARGLGCHLVLGGSEPERYEGNLLLDRLLGAEIHWSGALRKGERIPEVAAGLEARGRRPYVVPYGGSNEVGALGFVRAASELAEQLRAAGETVSRIVFASSSGGTHAGLVVGKALFGLGAQILGIGIDKGEAGEMPFEDHVHELASSLASRLGLGRPIGRGEALVRNEFLGGGYGVVGEAEREAISLLARSEGILLDPVYTGKAFGALLALSRLGEFSKSETILFWHTGGTPALFSPAGQTLL
ncbi:MAG TPA: D-cysteine desulfhydrase family protein [Rectinemataceae bacterium]|nr:D-cysteine desulfhydrase family protein [Rectinemataceae bacterium]